jgi:hypothetical protein
MEKNKAQITIFIIIALLVIFIIFGFIYIKNNFFNRDIRIDPDILPIYNSITKCVQNTGLDAIDYTSRRGGFYRAPLKKLDNDIAYYLYEDYNYMPEKEEIERQISYYIDDKLNNCLNSFKDFNEYEIIAGAVKSTTKISQGKVIFNINLPLTIKKNKTYTLENFEAEVPVRLDIIYDSLVFIMDDQMKDQETMCVTCFSYLSKEYGLDIETINYNQDSAIIVIKDEKSKLNNGSLVFSFANKYAPFEL